MRRRRLRARRPRGSPATAGRPSRSARRSRRARRRSPPRPTRSHLLVITGAGADAVSGPGTGAALLDGEKGVLRRGAPASALSVESCPLDRTRGDRAASATHEDTDGGVADTRTASDLKSGRRLRNAFTEVPSDWECGAGSSAGRSHKQWQCYGESAAIGSGRAVSSFTH